LRHWRVGQPRNAAAPWVPDRCTAADTKSAPTSTTSTPTEPAHRPGRHRAPWVPDRCTTDDTKSAPTVALANARRLLSVECVTLRAMSAQNRALDWFSAYQDGVLTRRQVLSSGVTAGALRHRIKPGGPWQRLLPGTYLTSTGQPTRQQLEVAAVLFAGPDSLITGPAAMGNYKIQVPQTDQVDVLVPAVRKRTSCGYVAVHRTRRMPRSATCDGPLRFAPPARAVADAVRSVASFSDARALVASAVQKNRCSIAELAAELREGPVRGSARLREILAEVQDGIRSVPEGDFRKLILQSKLPVPQFNATLCLHGRFLATVDAWWVESGVVVEIDSREWHLAPDDWEATMRRDRRLTAAGIRVLHISPRQLRTEPDRIVGDIAAALRTGQPVAGIITVPVAA
jgi:hypothetical protein